MGYSSFQSDEVQARNPVSETKPIANNLQIYQLVQERFAREAAILEDLGEATYLSSAAPSGASERLEAERASESWTLGSDRD